MAQPASRGGPSYGWEVVILRGGRREPGRDYPRDWLVCEPESNRLRDQPEYVTGAKPRAFCHWLFACAGLRAGDEFVDLFPGSGAVRREWEAWSAQLPLQAAEDLRGRPRQEVLA